MTTGSGLSAGTGLGALLAAIQRSPIVVRFASQLSQVRDPGPRKPGLGQLAKDTVGQCATFA